MSGKEDKPAPSALIEFSSEARADPNEGVVFEQTPIRCTCPHCERHVITFIDHETSWVTWLLGLVVWISLGWMAFWVLPVLWPAFKDVVHHCPRCLNVIATKSRISLPTFRSEVMTFKVGSCAVVLARKYVVIFVGLVGVIATVYCFRSSVHLQAYEIPKGPASKLTWEEFVVDCGPKPRLRHRSSSLHAFEKKYRQRTMTWEGEVKQIREGFDVFFFHTKSVLMVQMYPPRYPHHDHPDIAILFGESQNELVADLAPGDWIEFEATMAAKGYRGDPEVMMLWRTKVKPRPKDLKTSLPQAIAGPVPRSERGRGRHGHAENPKASEAKTPRTDVGATDAPLGVSAASSGAKAPRTDVGATDAPPGVSAASSGAKAGATGSSGTVVASNSTAEIRQ
jgi:hypothetical protein